MTTLRGNRDFMRLWVAHAVSALGSKVTTTAIPLTAAVTLHATPSQMAMLVIAGQLPDILFGLPAGSWIDRGHHRRYLVGADLGRALLIGCIPLAAVLGVLSFPLLVAVAFASATLSIFFSVAAIAILPTVVRNEHLVAANSRLQLANSVISLAGPGVAGSLIQLVSAPKALLVDACSYLVSAWSLGRAGVQATTRTPGTGSLVRDIRDGLRELVATPILRALTMSSAVFAIGLSMQATVLILFLTRSLHVSPAMIGVILACGGAGALLGSLVAGRVSTRIGPGPAIIGGTLLEAVAAFALPASILVAAPLLLVCAAQVANGIGAAIYSVNQVSLRQRIVDPRFLGRITAGRRFLTFSVAPAGAVIGGWLAEWRGLTAPLLAAAVLLLAGAAVMWASPVRAARNAPVAFA